MARTHLVLLGVENHVKHLNAIGMADLFHRRDLRLQIVQGTARPTLPHALERGPSEHLDCVELFLPAREEDLSKRALA